MSHWSKSEVGHTLNTVRVQFPDGTETHFGAWPTLEGGHDNPDATAAVHEVRAYLHEIDAERGFVVQVGFVDIGLPVFDVIDNWLAEQEWFRQMKEER